MRYLSFIPNSPALRRVLVVDDDPAVCLVVRVALEAFGHEVDHVHTGTDALDRLRGGEPVDVVLLDVRLPDGDGWDVRAELLTETSPPVIVMLSAYPNEGDPDALFLAKPFDEDDLAAVLARAGQAGAGLA